MNRSAVRKEALKIREKRKKCHLFYIYSSKLSAHLSLTVSHMHTRAHTEAEGGTERSSVERGEKYLSLMVCCNIMGDTKTFLVFDGKHIEELQQDLCCVMAQVSLHLPIVFTAVFLGSIFQFQACTAVIA